MYGYAISNVGHAVTSLSVYCIYFTLILFLVQAHQGHWQLPVCSELFSMQTLSHVSLSMVLCVALVAKKISFFEQIVLLAKRGLQLV